jgi:hypothetical protein
MRPSTDSCAEPEISALMSRAHPKPENAITSAITLIVCFFMSLLSHIFVKGARISRSRTHNLWLPGRIGGQRYERRRVLVSAKLTTLRGYFCEITKWSGLSRLFVTLKPVDTLGVAKFQRPSLLLLLIQISFWFGSLRRLQSELSIDALAAVYNVPLGRILGKMSPNTYKWRLNIHFAYRVGADWKHLQRPAEDAVWDEIRRNGHTLRELLWH